MSLLFLGCSADVDKFTKVNENDAAPSEITNYEIENLPGAAIVSYELPKGDDLLYVMAEYQLHDKVIQSKASYYDNHIKLEGFGEAKEYPVKLYSVSRGGKKSSPLSITINPLDPQVKTTFESFKISPAFGGFKLGFENFSETDLRLVVLTPDSLGDLYNPETFYTKRSAATFAVRGFEDKERSFGVFALDRWGNRSDTLFTTLTPLYEVILNKKLFKVINLPTDMNKMHAGGTWQRLYDDIYGPGAATFHTPPNSGIPQWFTLDLGVQARFSRMIMHSRGAPTTINGPYIAGDVKRFELYGSNNPNSDGSWDSWTLIGEYESIKPSPGKGITQEDNDYAVIKGHEFEFDMEDEIFRYIRFKTMETWGGVTYIYIAELTFYGQEVE